MDYTQTKTKSGKKLTPKQCRQAFERVLVATINDKPAADEELQLLIDYVASVERKIAEEENGNRYRPLYEVVVVILPEAIRLHRWVHEERPRLAAAGLPPFHNQVKGGATL